jgi:hypothetical protein
MLFDCFTKFTCFSLLPFANHFLVFILSINRSQKGSIVDKLFASCYISLTTDNYSSTTDFIYTVHYIDK